MRGQTLAALIISNVLRRINIKIVGTTWYLRRIFLRWKVYLNAVMFPKLLQVEDKKSRATPKSRAQILHGKQVDLFTIYCPSNLEIRAQVEPVRLRLGASSERITSQVLSNYCQLWPHPLAPSQLGTFNDSPGFIESRDSMPWTRSCLLGTQ
jgi:hypothetical protein